MQKAILEKRAYWTAFRRQRIWEMTIRRATDNFRKSWRSSKDQQKKVLGMQETGKNTKHSKRKRISEKTIKKIEDLEEQRLKRRKRAIKGVTRTKDYSEKLEKQQLMREKRERKKMLESKGRV